jgi:uncharacterized protein YbjT (DUF2867 family)
MRGAEGVAGAGVPRGHAPTTLPPPPPVVLGLGAAVAAALRDDDGGAKPVTAPAAAANEPAAVAVADAVAVFGASGKAGRELVAALRAAGRDVVAAVRDGERAAAALGPEGGRDGGAGALKIVAGVDVTRAATLAPSSPLWPGVTQAALALGPVVARTEDGGMGYVDGMTSEAVDARGVETLVAAIQAVLPRPRSPCDPVPMPVVVPMGSGSSLDAWEVMDDVIMGGSSASTLAPAGPDPADSTACLWSGTLVVEGGGFCGVRTRGGAPVDAARFDGLALRVRGDGSTLKLNVKTEAQLGAPEAVYQGLVPTAAGEWATVALAWGDFVPTRRARFDPAAPPLRGPDVRQVGLVLSRFEFNGAPNPACRPGPFKVEIDCGVRGFAAQRPAVVMLTSAAVERNARIGDGVEARAADVPIVRLNPGGALNWKFVGETALRRSGLPYAVVRATGFVDGAEDGGAAFPLEFHQGDFVAGTLTRADAARAVASALATPAATGKTVEVRRGRADDAARLGAGGAELDRAWRGAALDTARAGRGLPPFPAPAPPPTPPTASETAAIVADPRVAAAAAAGRGGRVRAAGEVGEGETVAPAADGRAAVPAPDEDAGADADTPASRAADAREWVRAWRARTLERALPEAVDAGAR